MRRGLIAFAACRAWPWLAAILMLAGLQPAAWAIDTRLHGATAVCLSGTCTDGVGTIRTSDAVEFSGLWTRGRFTGGTPYQVRMPLAPQRTFELVVDDDGLPLKGTVLRGSTLSGAGVVGEYTGTFARTTDAATGRTVAVFDVGRYKDHMSEYVYDGEFSFVPAMHGGHFVFQGVRIDDDADEVVRGLFVSDASVPGGSITFHKARPDYLLKLQQDIAAQRAQAQARESENARENMSAVMNVLGGLLAINNAGSNLSSLRSSSLASLTSGLARQQSSGDLLKRVVAQVVQQAAGDENLARLLGDTSNVAGVVSSLTGKSRLNVPMTRSQYAAQLAFAVMAPDTPSADNGPSTGNALVDAIGKATIDRTMNKVAAAVGGSGGGMALATTSPSLAALMQPSRAAVAPQAPTPPVARPATAAPLVSQNTVPTSCLRADEIGDKAAMTPACYRGRQNTFGWGDTQADACTGARRGLRDEFNGGKNPSGCYCSANAKVNSVVQPFVCWILFD